VVLSDVAKVASGYAEQTNIVHVNGRRATYLTILKHSEASSLEVVDATRALLPDIRKAAPPNVDINLDFDQSVYVRSAIHNVASEAVIASLLVSLMVPAVSGQLAQYHRGDHSIPLAIFAASGVVFHRTDRSTS
jgi:multidrug efflux pump subunit AcrB